MGASRLRLAAIVACAIPGICGAEVDVEVAAGSTATSNVFADRGQESDVALHTSLNLDYGIDRDWAVGYGGKLHAYVEHAEFTTHDHSVRVVSNPTWGEQGANDLWTELGVTTLRNDDSYASLNLVRPALSSQLSLEPFPGFRWGLGAELSYRWYYDEGRSDSFDTLLNARAGYTLPTRTTVILRPVYGVRRYLESTDDDSVRDVDQRMDAAARVGQALWKNAGLQLDYRYRFTAGDSGLLQRKLTETQFQLLGDGFLHKGHRGRVGVKQILGEPWTIGVALTAEERVYDGWPALDEAVQPTGEDRRDVRLQPRAYLSYEWFSRSAGSLAQEAGVTLAYQHTRQRSNSYWHDTVIDVVTVDVWSVW